MATRMTVAPVGRETMLRLAYAHAAAATGEAMQAGEETAVLLSLSRLSAESPSFAAERDAAERLARLWQRAARELAILEAVRGLSDPATYEGDTSPPAVSERGSTPLPPNLEPGNLNVDAD